MTPSRRAWLARIATLASALLLPHVPLEAAQAEREKERAEVPEPAPVTVGKLRLEAPAFTRARGLPQNGGYVQALDSESGRERWIVKIYDAAPDDGKESDKRDIFIADMSLERGGRTLLVTDERGRRFRLDLKTRKVRALGVAAAPARKAGDGETAASR